MRLLRDLRHDNINSFIGACVEPMRILLVTDYCAKGSLYDIIENEDIKLDDLFIASLVHDLIKVSTIFAISCCQYFCSLIQSKVIWFVQKREKRLKLFFPIQYFCNFPYRLSLSSWNCLEIIFFYSTLSFSWKTFILA